MHVFIACCPILCIKCLASCRKSWSHVGPRDIFEFLTTCLTLKSRLWKHVDVCSEHLACDFLRKVSGKFACCSKSSLLDLYFGSSAESTVCAWKPETQISPGSVLSHTPRVCVWEPETQIAPASKLSHTQSICIWEPLLEGSWLSQSAVTITKKDHGWAKLLLPTLEGPRLSQFIAIARRVIVEPICCYHC
jgi:hypothetical protein